ncbi:hypothetical protein Dfri01_50520 [Dyadobacter frigoris]|nr:hypothetical protein Dfri01_50520 [Dyadobacter frigoris]
MFKGLKKDIFAFLVNEQKTMPYYFKLIGNSKIHPISDVVKGKISRQFYQGIDIQIF